MHIIVGAMTICEYSMRLGIRWNCQDGVDWDMDKYSALLMFWVHYWHIWLFRIVLLTISALCCNRVWGYCDVWYIKVCAYSFSHLGRLWHGNATSIFYRFFLLAGRILLMRKLISFSLYWKKETTHEVFFLFQRLQ